MAKKPSIPTPYLVLGLAGLIPFALCLAGLVMGQSTVVAWSKIALTGYGAVILSFLGGIKWGLMLKERNHRRHWSPLLTSIVPSLIGWSALLVNTSLGMGILIVGFAVQYYLDRATVEAGQAPNWVARLRLLLTLCVELLLLAAIAVVWLEIRF